MGFIKWILIVLLILVLAFALLVGLRLLSYEQVDSTDRVLAKQAYLAELTLPPGRSVAPNIVVILLDDLGYGDLGVYGSGSIDTPAIDSLAAGGMAFSHYYSPSPVCTPSRAAMLSGRYPPRTGLGHVVFPQGSWLSNLQKITGLNTRLPSEEILLPEVLRAVGYRTGMVGKWHLGDVAPSLPNDFGFDSYFGGLYSNDMKPFPLYRNRDIDVPAELDQTTMRDHFTREVVAFVDQQSEETPFFLYFSHHFPHEPLFSSPQQSGRSNAGLYGDVVEDIDHSVAALLAALDRGGFADNTLVIFTSDNGPWYQGSPGFVRGRKNQTWEGGQRVPLIVRWPAKVAAGQWQDTPVSGVDLFPTILAALGLPLPPDRAIDGMDLGALLRADGELANRYLYYFSQAGDTLDAVRGDRFKYHRRRGVRATGLGDYMSISAMQGPWLIDLDADPQESYDVSARYPEHRRRLADVYADKVEEMSDNPRGWLAADPEVSR